MNASRGRSIRWWLANPQAPATSRRKAKYYLAVIRSASLIAFSIVTYYLPMRQAFWNSTDEGEMLYWTNTTPLSEIMAQGQRFEARPLEMLGVEIAQVFSPDSIDGFLWLAFMLRLASALLICGLVQELLGGQRIAMLAALMFMVNPSEPW